MLKMLRNLKKNLIKYFFFSNRSLERIFGMYDDRVVIVENIFKNILIKCGNETKEFKPKQIIRSCGVNICYNLDIAF